MAVAQEITRAARLLVVEQDDSVLHAKHRPRRIAAKLKKTALDLRTVEFRERTREARHENQGAIGAFARLHFQIAGL